METRADGTGDVLQVATAIAFAPFRAAHDMVGMTIYERRRHHRILALRRAEPIIKTARRYEQRRSIIAGRMLDGWSYEAAAGEVAGVVEAYGEDTRTRVVPLPPDVEETAYQEALRLSYAPPKDVEFDTVGIETRHQAARLLRVLRLESVIEAIYRAQQGLCMYCNGVLGSRFHVDHKMPIARGGRTIETNLCCACPICNLTKHARTAEEFILSRAGGR